MGVIEPRASKAELAQPLGALFRAMPQARGTRAADRLDGYMTALSGFTLDEVEAGIAKFLRGEIDGISQKYCPHPPELAAIVRKVSADTVEPSAPKARLWRYRRPKSGILERNITKAWALHLVDNRIHPRRSIWCPGPINDNPDYGDLFAPDDDWKPAAPLDSPPPQTTAPFVEANPAARARVQELLRKTGHHVWQNGQIVDPKPAPPPEPRKVPDYSGDKIEITEELAAQLKARADQNFSERIAEIREEERRAKLRRRGYRKSRDEEE